MQRKTVTISRTIFEMLKELNSNDRHIIWDMILESLFDGKKPQINGEDIHSDSIRNAFICLNHELNILQKQYENRVSSQKKSKQNSRGLLCPNECIQSYPTLSNLNQVYPTTSSDINVSYNINNHKNNNNKINNNIYNTNQQTNNIQSKTIKKDTIEFALTDENKQCAVWWKERLQDETKKIEKINHVVAYKFDELVKRIAGELKPLKVQGYYTAPEVILEKYLDIFRCEPEEAEMRLEEIFDTIEERTSKIKINNKYKYLVGYIYNVACDY